MRNPPQHLSWLVERGSEIAGGAAAVGVGAMLGGTEGAAAGLVGAVVAPIVAQVSEFAMRSLGRREEERVAAVVVYACDMLKDLEAKGASVRSDGFFEDFPEARSDGEEVIEAVMKAAQASYEERKLPHLGALLGLLAVDETYDRGTANWMIRSAEELSWTQYVLLALVPSADSDQEALPAGGILANAPDWNAWTAQHELADLGYGKRELVSWGTGRTPIQQLSFPSAEMSEMRLRHGGVLLHNALDLADVPQAERVRVRGLLAPDELGKGSHARQPSNP